MSTSASMSSTHHGATGFWSMDTTCPRAITKESSAPQRHHRTLLAAAYVFSSGTRKRCKSLDQSKQNHSKNAGRCFKVRVWQLPQFAPGPTLFPSPLYTPTADVGIKARSWAPLHHRSNWSCLQAQTFSPPGASLYLVTTPIILISCKPSLQ